MSRTDDMTIKSWTGEASPRRWRCLRTAGAEKILILLTLRQHHDVLEDYRHPTALISGKVSMHAGAAGRRCVDRGAIGRTEQHGPRS